MTGEPTQQDVRTSLAETLPGLSVALCLFLFALAFVLGLWISFSGLMPGRFLTSLSGALDQGERPYYFQYWLVSCLLLMSCTGNAGGVIRNTPVAL
tara:strand:- start:128 stop:415 length:288 start_codon:yes stop_codon:yes gene_type:complete